MQGKESSWLYDFLIAVENINDYPTDIQKFYWQIVGTLQ